MYTVEARNDICKVLREIRNQVNNPEYIRVLDEIIDNLSGLSNSPESPKENTSEILKEIAGHLDNPEYIDTLNKVIDYVNGQTKCKSDATGKGLDTTLSALHEAVHKCKEKLTSPREEAHTETLDEFIKEIEQIFKARKNDLEGFGYMLADISYDPVLRMNRIHEWEKMIIYTAWNDKNFVEELRSEDNQKRKDAIYKLFTRGQKIQFKFPPDLKIYVHENTDKELHFVIPQRESDRPLGY